MELSLPQVASRRAALIPPPKAQDTESEHPQGHSAHSAGAARAPTGLAGDPVGSTAEVPVIHILALMLAMLIPIAAHAQGAENAEQLIATACLACHPQLATSQAMEEAGWLVRGDPRASALITSVDDDSMPPGAPLAAEDRDLLRDWVAAGANPSADGMTPGTALADASAVTGPARKIRFHRIAGYSSGGLLLAGGAVGATQLGTFMSEGHAYREANGIGEGQMDSTCSAYIQDLWDNPKHRALRYTHAGLLAAGGTLYLSNAVSGMRMRSRAKGVTIPKLHRWAFYTHAALMLSEAGLGVWTSNALSRGAHEEVRALGITHSVIGVTIPVMMIGSGIAVDLAPSD